MMATVDKQEVERPGQRRALVPRFDPDEDRRIARGWERAAVLVVAGALLVLTCIFLFSQMRHLTWHFLQNL